MAFHLRIGDGMEWLLEATAFCISNKHADLTIYHRVCLHKQSDLSTDQAKNIPNHLTAIESLENQSVKHTNHSTTGGRNRTCSNLYFSDQLKQFN